MSLLTLDNSWESLFKPGEAFDYFILDNAAQLNTEFNNFNATNAWWLAEFSRLIYHNNFFENENINLGALNYELLDYIECEDTSTRVGLINIIQEKPCMVIVFQGTDEIEDWNINIHAYQSTFGDNGKVHSGFKKAYLSIRDELHHSVAKNKYPFFITGHSLGAALATLAFSELSDNKNFHSCYTFGSPRTGEPKFIDSIQSDRIYRVINNSDVVTTIPIDFANIVYKHIGKPCLIDNKGILLNKADEDEVYEYQISKLGGLKEYAISKIFNNDLKSIKDDLPSFLSDHAPINYVLKLQNLL